MFFIQFLFLGWFYLIYKIIVLDTKYILKKAYQPVSSKIDTLFSHSLYRLFKESINQLYN